ncbi:MAG: AAA family ATPase [Gemmatimonadaceae bacterium]
MSVPTETSAIPSLTVSPADDAAMTQRRILRGMSSALLSPPEREVTTVALHTLGQCVAEVGDARIGPEAERLFALALYLGLERGRRVSRESLVALLWPEVPPDKGAHSLRQTAYRLRTLGAPVASDRSHLWIAAEHVRVDVARLGAVQAGETAEEVAESVGGSFLPSYAPSFSRPFAEWIDRQRDIVNSAIRRVLVAAVAGKRARGDWSGVEALSGACLAIDPLNEEATLASAEAAALHGGKVQALAILDRYLREIGPGAREIRLPATLLRRRIMEVRQLDLVPQLSEPPFVGRDAEVADLNRALRAAQGGQGSAHLLWGEAGIGKTRLLAEFTRAATLGRAQLVRSATQSTDERRPLAAFVDLVPALLALPGAIGCSPESMRYLRRMVEHDPREPLPSADTREAASLYASIRRSVFDLLDAVAAETCLVLVIEDAHWLDAMSWEVLAEAIPWLATRRLLLLLSARVPDPQRRNRSLGDVPALQRRHLRPLAEGASRTLLDTVIRRTAAPMRMALAEWCVTTGGGNPYYLAELALHGLREGEPFRVPDSLGALVAERLSVLRPVAVRVLQACAILGKHSTLPRLEIVLAQSRLELLDALDELEAHGLIVAGEEVIQSKHHLLAQAAIARLSGLSRRLLHRHSAVALELEVAGSQYAATLWECAEHWTAAGDVPRAIRFLRSCAAHALEMGVPAEAATLLERAAALTPVVSERAELVASQASALRLAGQWEAILPVFDTLTRLRVKVDPNYDGHDDEELALCEARWRGGTDAFRTLAQLRQCLQNVGATPNHRVKAATLSLVMADNLFDGRSARGDYRAVSQLLQSDAVAVSARLSLELIFHSAFGDHPAAVIAARELLKLARANGDAATLVRSLQHSAQAMRDAGHVPEALNLAGEGYTLACRRSFGSARCSIANSISWTYRGIGDLTSAAHWYHKATNSLSLIQDRAAVAGVKCNGSLLALSEGNHSLAEQLLEESIVAWTPYSHPRWKITVTAARVAIQLARSTQALPAIVLSDLHDQYLHARGHCGHDFVVATLARGLVAQHRATDARQLIQEYLRLHRREVCDIAFELKAAIEAMAA